MSDNQVPMTRRNTKGRYIVPDIYDNKATDELMNLMGRNYNLLPHNLSDASIKLCKEKILDLVLNKNADPNAIVYGASFDDHGKDETRLLHFLTKMGALDTIQEIKSKQPALDLNTHNHHGKSSLIILSETYTGYITENVAGFTKFMADNKADFGSKFLDKDPIEHLQRCAVSSLRARHNHSEQYKPTAEEVQDFISNTPKLRATYNALRDNFKTDAPELPSQAAAPEQSKGKGWTEELKDALNQAVDGLKNLTSSVNTPSIPATSTYAIKTGEISKQAGLNC